MLYKLTDYNYNSIATFGKYRISYKRKNGIISANPDTLGLMLFTDTIDMGRFIDSMGGGMYRILLVEAIDEIVTPKVICYSMNPIHIDEFYQFYQKTSVRICMSKTPPKGTVCCQSIRVLEEFIN